MLLLSFFKSKEVHLVNQTIDYILGKWEGFYTQTIDTPAEIIQHDNNTVEFKHEQDSFVRADILNANGEQNFYFFKPIEGSNDTLQVLDAQNEEISIIKIHKTKDDDYLIRGLLMPSNDQITVAIENHYITLSITDQFSSKTFLVNLKYIDSFGNKVRTLSTLGIGIIICGAIIYSFSKATDLSDVIKPDEANYAKQVKAASIRADETKKTEKQAKSKKQDKGKKQKTQ